MSAPNPPFSDEHEELRSSARGFIERELAPHAQQWEEERWFPNEVFAKLAAQGLLGLKYPDSYGGQGGDYLHEAVLCEEMARIGSGGTAAGIGAHINIATPPIWKFGSEEQKQAYLVPAIRGERIGALGITEPGAGSDVAALATRAERVDGGFVVNGEKTYITNGVRADFIVTAVKTTPEGGHSGISFLIVDRGEGVTSSALHKLG
jgi:acyl-CoA dehydrogenase